MCLSEDDWLDPLTSNVLTFLLSVQLMASVTAGSTQTAKTGVLLRKDNMYEDLPSWFCRSCS